MKKEKIKPRGNRVIIRRDKLKGVSEAGILLVGEAPSQWGIIWAAGSEVKEVKRGDRVMFYKTAGTTIIDNGEKLLLMRENDILLKVEHDMSMSHG